jgi:2-octaprenyl-6-methoxyphenol hydroxylase
MMSTIDYDCVIIGAGFVGASLAIALQKCGFRALVIDGRSPLVEVGSEDARGIALSPSSRLIFEDLGLWNTLAESSAIISEIHVSEMGALPSVNLNAREIGADALAYVVPADHLLRSIENKLLLESKVSWRTTLENYELKEDRVELSVIEHDGQAKTLTAQLLIGADGVNSKVRSLAGINTKVRAYAQQAIVANVKLKGIKPNCAYERFTPTGPLALLPSAGGRHVLVRCCLLEETETLLALDDEAFIADVTARFARPIGEFSELGKRRSHPLVLSQSDDIVAERVALVGAAAVTVHPNGAQGLNLGMRDIAELCHALSASKPDQFVDGQDCSFASRQRLEKFANNRRKDHRRVIRFTDGLARGFSSDVFGVSLVRNIGMLATKFFPALQRQIIYQGIGQGRSARLPFSGHSS